MTFRRKRAATAAVAAVMVGTLAACTAASATGQDASFWSLTGGAEPMVRQMVVDWNETNPDQQIEHELFAGDVFRERIRTAVGSANAPTLIHSWAGGPLREYVANDQVIDISDAASGLLERVVPSIAANGAVDGEQFAVPYTHTSIVNFFYNREVFEAAGVDAPPTTWSEFLDAVDALRDHGVTPISLAAGSRWPLLMWIQYLTDRVGGPEVFQAVLDGEEGAWSHPAIIDALTRIQDLVDRGAFGDAFGSVMADQHADLALVHTGNAGMLLHLSSAFPNFLRDAPDFVERGSLGFFAFPAVQGGTGDVRNLVGNPSLFLSVSADAPESAQETAKAFIETEVLNDERIDDLLAIGNIPPILGIEDRIAGLPNEDFMMFSYDLLANSPHFQLSWDQALDGAQAQALLDNLSEIFLGRITPAEFASRMGDVQ